MLKMVYGSLYVIEKSGSSYEINEPIICDHAKQPQDEGSGPLDIWYTVTLSVSFRDLSCNFQNVYRLSIVTNNQWRLI